MIVMNDKILDARSVEPTVIQMMVLGDDDPSQCNGRSTHGRPCHGGSPDDHHRQFTSLPMNGQSTFPRQAQDQYNIHNNGKGLAYDDSATHSREGNKYSDEAAMKSNKRKLDHGEGSDINSLKLPRTCHNFNSKLERGLVRVPLGTERQDRKEVLLPRCEDHRRMEEIGRVACDGNRQYKTSRRDEQFVGNMNSVSQENPTKYKNDCKVESKWSCSSNDRRLVQASLAGYDKVSIHKNPMKFQDHLEDGEKSPTAFPINSFYNPSNGNWKDTNRLFIGQEGQKMDILKGPLPSSFAGQGSRSWKFESKGSSGVLNHSDCHESPGQKEANVTDALCNVSSTSDSQKFSLSSEQNFHLPSSKANNGDASKNNSNPLPSYNGPTWHPFYSCSSPVSNRISAPMLASHVTTGTGLGTYSHLNVHFPHYFSAKLPSGHQSPLSSLLAITPQLDSTYGENLGPLASTYNCYHPKHLQASSQAQRPAAYGQLNLYPVMWQNGNVDIHSGPQLLASHQDYVNGETIFNMSLLNPWSFHQSQNNIDERQPALGQFSSKSNSKELLASSSLQASSAHFYEEDVNGTELCEDFSHPFPHGLRKVKVQNAECEPALNVQLYKELAFKQDLGSHDQIESQINKKDNANMLAEVRDMKPLALAFRNEQNTKCREPASISPNPRPTLSSKESSTSALDLTTFKHTPNFASKTGTDTRHQQLTNDKVKRGLSLEVTSLYSAVDDTILLQHPPFHRQPRESGQRMKDHNLQYKAPLSLLQPNTLDSKDTFGDLTFGHLQEKYGLAKDLALPVSLATPNEVHHPSELPLMMPTSKSPALTKTLALVPKEIMKEDCNGRLESEKTRDLIGISNKASVYNQMPPTPCPSASEKQITVVPQMELCEKINKGTHSRIDLIGSVHQESNTNCNPFNEEDLSNSNSPTSKPSNEDLGQYNNLSPLNSTLNTKRFTQVTNTTSNYYTLKKYKAARTASPCPKKLSSECPPSVGEMRTNNVKRDSSSPKVPMSNVSPVKQLSCQDAFNAGASSRLNAHSCHTKLKKAWLTRHSEQDSTREQQGSSGKETASAQIVSKGIETEPAAVLNNSKTQEESVKRLAAKRRYEHRCDSEHSDVADNRHWLRTRREGKSGQVLEEEEKNSKKEEEELRGARTLNRKLENENGHVQNDRPSAPQPKDPPRVMLLKSAGESFLQDVPCTELFTNVPRCRDCWPSRSRKGQELPPFSSACRFMHLRRLSISRNGGLKVEGFSTEEQVNKEAVLETSPSPRETGLEADTSAYILAHVGNSFCDLVLAERRLLERIAESSDVAIACKAPIGEKEETCDSCHSVVFNVHWVCPRCGFFVCMSCYDMKQKKERGEEGTAWLKCVKGHSHDIKSLRPTQLVANSALVGLCEKMHSSKRRLGIKSNCACVNGEKKWLNKTPAASKSPKPQTDAKVELSHSLTPGEEPAKSTRTAELSQGSNSNHASLSSHSPLQWLAELAAWKAEEETNEVDVPHSRPGNTSASRSAAYHGSRRAEQCSTLCDLLTTTAGKLRLGCTDAGMAFAPVYTPLNSCDTAARSMPSILDEIIASVVERKIPITKSPKQSKEEQSVERSQRKESDSDPKQTEEQPVSIHYSRFSKGIFPWIQNCSDKNNWKVFQEHWIKGVPVLVSGVLTATDSNFWGPECLRQELGEESVSLVNCRGHSVVTRARSKEFWEGFKTHSKCPRLKARGSKMLRLDYCASEKEFSERMPAQFEELHRHLPLPEYTRNDGKLNLISRLPAESRKSQLELRVYGLSLDDNTGSSGMCVELTDTLHILVHAEPPLEDRDTLEKAILARLEGDSVDDTVRRRLRELSERPGALWHIYRTQDTETISDFLQKVVEYPAGQDGFLDHVVRRRLLEECGVGSRAVLQFRGDALVIPMATMYQVQYFTSCITVTKGFVSPEHVKHSFQTMPLSANNNSCTQHKLQMKRILYETVKDCVQMLRATSPS